MARPENERAWIAVNIVDWDEYGQGYVRDDSQPGGIRLGVCICGLVMTTTDEYEQHECPYDDYVDDEDDHVITE